MPGKNERVDLELGIVDDHLEGARHVLVGTVDAEVLKACGLRPLDGHRDQGRGGLESHPHEHDLTIRVLLSQLERVKRRVDDLDRPTCSLLGEQAGSGARHARHIPEGGDGDALDAGEGDDLVDIVVRRHAHRAPGAGGEAHAFGHERPDPVAGDGHRVRAAHLHERCSPIGNELADGLDQSTSEARVLERLELRLEIGCRR